MAGETTTLISTTTVGAGGVGSITFSSIPQTYTDLFLICSIRTNYNNINELTTLYFNGVNANQGTFYGYSTGSTVNGSTTAGIQLVSSGSTSAANSFGNTEIYIPNYTSSTQDKGLSIDSVGMNGNNTSIFQALYSAWWTNTAAITSITFLPQGTLINQYSTISLYGIKAL